MAVWNSSSLAFTDSSNMNPKNPILKSSKTRVSKQNLLENKMFGSKRKNIQLGKIFRKSGKGIMKNPTSAMQQGNSKSSGVSPSMAEFDKMMSGLSKGSNSSKKSMFSRKQFG